MIFMRVKFNTRMKNYKKKQEKEDTLDSLSNFFNARKIILMALKVEYL